MEHQPTPPSAPPCRSTRNSSSAAGGSARGRAGVKRISPEAPVPVVERQSERHVPGDDANAAANAAGLGAHVLLAGVVGGDDSGKRLCSALPARKIDIEGLLVDSSRSTTKTRILAQNQQILRIDDEDRAPLPAALEERLGGFIEQRLVEVDACLLSDYAKGVVFPRLAARLMHRARTLGKPVLIDPKGTDFQKYRGASLVKPNLYEAALFLQRSLDTEQAAVASGKSFADMDKAILQVAEV